MRFIKTITGIAGGFVFSLGYSTEPGKFSLIITEENGDPHDGMCLRISGKEQIEQFLEACQTILVKLREFKSETP